MAASAVYQEMLIKKLTEAEEALKHLQFDNEKLQEQVSGRRRGLRGMARRCA